MTNPSMQQLFEDMGKLFGSALGTAGAMKDEAARHLHNLMAEILARMDIPTREEIAVLQSIIEKQEKRLTALEAQLEQKPAKPAKPAKKAAKK